MSRLTPEHILGVVAEYYGTPVADLTGADRAHHLVHQRHAAMFVVHRNTNLTMTKIGKLFGGRDHSTISIAIKDFEWNLELIPAYKIEVDQILAKLHAPQPPAPIHLHITVQPGGVLIVDKDLVASISAGGV